MPILKQLVSNSAHSKRRSRADLTAEMISAPLGDFRHTMHVGRAGDAFGDTSFLNSKAGEPEPPRGTGLLQGQPAVPQIPQQQAVAVSDARRPTRHAGFSAGLGHFREERRLPAAAHGEGGGEKWGHAPQEPLLQPRQESPAGDGRL
uniref:CRIB domain-containing protein n=1 Tax=Pelusios castaneus TaxID=367368 RepID=A0A8C8VHH2_9SAUR